MLITKEVSIKWSGRTKNYYEDLGYVYTGNLTPLTIKTEDLPKQSHVVVDVQCDLCQDNNKTLPYREYVKTYEGNNYYCKPCDLKQKFNDIKNRFQERQYIIVSDVSDYNSVTSKVKFVCKKHRDKGILQIRVSQFNSGSGCKYCGKEKSADAIRISYATVLEEFKKKDLILATKEYKTSDELLDFICEHHKEKGVQKIRYRAVKDGQGCRFCGTERQSEKRKHSFEFVKTEFEKRGYTLMDKEYIQTREKLNYVCKVHPEEVQQIEFRALYNQNQGCRLCAIEAISGENNWNWKGGISSLSMYLRQFLLEWKKESMKLCEYKCVISGEKSNGSFEVHHLMAVNLIVSKILKEAGLEAKPKIQDYSDSEMDTLIYLFVRENNKLYGVVLKPCFHKLFHENYGYGNNTPEQFEEFSQRYKNGEFDEILNERRII